MTFATGLVGMWHRSRFAMVLLALMTLRPAVAQDDAAGDPPPPRGVPLAEPELANVGLNHFSATWESVLNQLAEDTGSTLVLHDVPSGRFSRRDWKKHTPSEAVRILNQQLEPRGYRILMKDQFLTVIEVQRARAEYPRHEIPHGASEQPAAEQQAVRSEPITVTDAGLFEGNGAPRFRPLADFSRFAESADVEIIQVDDEQPAVPEDAVDANVEQQPIQTQVVPTRQLASEIAGQLYEAFSDRSDLIEMGPTGLPAFQAYRRPLENGHAVFGDGAVAQRPIWFLVEVDSRLNSLTVHAAVETAEGVTALIHKLDVPATPDEAVRLVTDTEDAAMLAERLNQEMRYLRQGREQIELSQQPDDPATQQPIPQEGTTGEAPPLEEMEFPQLIGNLRGDVTVEALEELDLLILRGNEADVEAVMAVIRTIEMMAAGSTPIINLHFLENVDSEALAELLNEVYENLGEVSSSAAATRATRPVSVIPVGNPNAILILAPQNSIDAIVDLVELLDTPVFPGSEVQVFRLRTAVASQIVTMLESFYEDRPGLGTEIRIIADVRTNSVIVNARPNELDEVRRLVRRMDRDPRGVITLRHIRLEHALADEVAEFMTTMVQSVLNPAQAPTGQAGFGAGGQAAQELRDTRSVVLEYLTTDENAQRMVRSGLLMDVRFNSDLRTNSLIITAPEASLRFFEELVKVLDQPTTTVADIKVFPLYKADAEAAAELLQSLFPEPEEGELGVQVAGTDDAGSGLVPLRVSVDLRTNSIIAVGSQDVLDVVAAILFRLDSGEQTERETRVIRLHNNPAFDIADAINQFLQSQRDLLQLDPDRISGLQLLEQEIIVTPEPISNTLIVQTSPRYFNIILQLVEELDREPEQVMIQALIVEVVLEDTDEFGVELGFQDSLLFDRSVILSDALTTISSTSTSASGVTQTAEQIISSSGTPGFPFNNNPLGNNTAVHPSGVGTQGLSNFGFGRTNADLGFGGLVLSASSEAVSVLIRALSSRRDINILSRPQILALDNQIAQIQVGQVVPVVTDFAPATATTAATPVVTQDDAGIILTVTPRISPNGQIVMEVAAEKSQYIDEGVALFTDITTGFVVESPIKDITTALTTIKVPDGQTVVMGGMITRTELNDERKVPWLGDVPIIGNAFGYDLHDHRRTELLIFLTPRIIRNDADSELIKQVEMDRLHFFYEQAEMIHGPLYGVPAPESEEPTIDLYGRGIYSDPGTNQEPMPLPPLPENGDDELRPMSSAAPVGRSQRGVIQPGG